MSKLTKLCGKLVENVTIGEGEDALTLVLKVPKVKELSGLIELFNKEGTESMSADKLEQISKILFEMIKQNVPDATEDEINEIMITNLNKLVEGLTSLLSKAFDNGKK